MTQSVTRMMIKIVCLSLLFGGVGWGWPAYAFTPLKICPPLAEKDKKAFIKNLETALEKGDETDIETYMALVQCRSGRPFSMRKELYISIRNPGSPRLNQEVSEKLTQTLFKAVGEKEVVAHLTGEIPSSENLTLRADVIKTALFPVAENKTGAKGLQALARKVADSLVEAREAGTGGLYFQKESPNDETGSVSIIQANAEAAAALALYGAKTGEDRYLESAKAAAQKLGERPMTLDFTATAARAYMRAALSRTLPQERDKHLLRSTELLRKGVFSAMYESGKYEGMWLDPATQFLENRYDIVYYTSYVLISLPSARDERIYLLDRLNALVYAIGHQYKTHRGIQVGDKAARMHCGLRRLEGFALEPTGISAPASAGVNRYIDTSDKSPQDWFQTSYHFILSDLVHSKGRFLTSPYSILCILKTAEKSP